MPRKYCERVLVQYTEPRMAAERAPGQLHEHLGTEHKECFVDIEIDFDAIVRTLGRKACTNVTKRSVDGHIVVRRSGEPRLTKFVPKTATA